MTTNTNSVNWVYTPPVKPVTPKDIYGTHTPPVPKGYQIVDFRVPRPDDLIIPEEFRDNDGPFFSSGNFTNPRFILAKLPAQPATAPDGYEFTGEYRTPRISEWFLNGSGKARSAELNYGAARFFILRPIPTPTLESIYGTDTPVIPKGWESTGVVKVPAVGERYLCYGAYGLGFTCGSVGETGKLIGQGQRLILRKKAEPVKSEPKFKVGDWVKGDDGLTVVVGQIRGIQGDMRNVTGGYFYHTYELTPVAAPPSGFKYTKV